MITAVIVSPEKKIGGVAKSAIYQGQWCYFAGVDANGESYFAPIATTGVASYSSTRLFPVQYFAPTADDADLYLDTDTTPVPSGTRLVGYLSPGVMIEDDYVYTRVGSGTYVSGTVGDFMYLNASGYPWVNDHTAGDTPIAIFMGLKGTTVQYLTLATHSGTAA